MIQLVPNKSLKQQLPEPTAEQMLHSELLTNEIINSIQNNGNWLSFRDYMNLALYHPLYGYYTSGNRKIGNDGDFITAPELGPLFAYGISQQILPILKKHPDFAILEFGAGTGKLAFNLLLELDAHQQLPSHYYIMEVSADLADRQKQTFKNLPTHIKNRIHWLNTLPEDNSLQAIILANEVVDAMPVNLFQYEHNQINELGLSVIDNNIFWQPLAADVYLSNYLEENIQPIWCEAKDTGAAPSVNGTYISEINFLAQAWLASISQCLAQGLIIIIDYGFPRQEYYHHDRSSGTVMCHYKHYAHQDALLYPGLQDITAHVDFTALAETAVANDLDVACFINQANFLLANQVTNYIDNHKNDENIFKLKQELKVLTSPAEMGELFKIILLNKNLNFSFFEHLQPYDRRGSL